jgi:hypothetical protein
MPTPSSALLLAALAPTLLHYSNWPGVSVAVNYNSTTWMQCDGPFALCYLARCTGVLPHTKPPQAACGCVYGPDATGGLTASRVQPSFTLSKPAALADAVACYGGQDPVVAGATPGTPAPCAPPPAGAANAAPVCKALGVEEALYGPPFKLVSTFAPASNQRDVTCTGAADGGSAYANCMTAACVRGVSGAPVTCFCPVVRVAAGAPFVVAYDASTSPGGAPPGLCESTRWDGATLSGRPVVVDR